MVGTWKIDDDITSLLVAHTHLGRRRNFQTNEVLYDQDEMSKKFFFVEKGLVKVSMLRLDGSEIILELMGPHTICGEGPAFDGLPRFSRGVATRESVAVEFDTAILENMCADYPKLAAAMLRTLSLKQRIISVKLEQMTSQNTEGRLLELLGRLERKFAVPHPRGNLLVTYLTHEQIASMTGMSRVTITRTIAKLKKRGKIDIVDKNILMLSE